MIAYKNMPEIQLRRQVVYLKYIFHTFFKLQLFLSSSKLFSFAPGHESLAIHLLVTHYVRHNTKGKSAGHRVLASGLCALSAASAGLGGTQPLI